jgi:hypothetical protein
MLPGTGVDVADSTHAAPWRMRDSPPKLPSRERGRGPSPHGGGVVTAEGAEPSRRWARRHHGGGRGVVAAGARAPAAAGVESSRRARGHRRRRERRRHDGREGIGGGGREGIMAGARLPAADVSHAPSATELTRTGGTTATGCAGEREGGREGAGVGYGPTTTITFRFF